MSRQDSRGWENVNVLAPHIAAMSKLSITKAHIPRSWKEAKLTPIHRKGPVTDPCTGSRELQDDCVEQHHLQAVCQPVALFDSRLVQSTQHNSGHTVWLLPQLQYTATPLHPAALARCGTDSATGITTTLHCLH